jgi:molybdenum cofactor cytidylyltransferase
MLLSYALRIHSGDVVTFTGAGGKTTLMFRLAEELRAAGLTVITTTTTRVSAEQTRLAPARLALDTAMAPDVLAARVGMAIAAYGHVFLYSPSTVEPGKVAGISPQVVDTLAARRAADVIIVEGDGARRLPFKAPAEHEPVVPAATTILAPVVGLDVLGAPLDVDHVHRPERIAGLTGAAPDDSVTPALIAAVLAHPQGGIKGLPPVARLVPVLNKTDDPPRLDAAHEIARLLLAAGEIDGVIIARAQGGATLPAPPDSTLFEDGQPALEAWTRTGAVVLAAGGASRYGALKQLLPWRDARPLVAHVAAQALACPDVSRVVVTVGADAEQVRHALAGYAVEAVDVPDWAEGQSRSVRAGLAALLTGNAHAGEPGAVLFLLADQPGISPGLLSALITKHRQTLAPVVAPRYHGRRGNPVLFDAGTFPEFDALQGDIGARPILQAHRDAIAWVDWPTPEVVEDIDTPENYRDLAARK